jgi:hypothetical protein
VRGDNPPERFALQAQLTHGYARFEAKRTHFRIEALDSQGDSAGRVFDEVTLTRFAPNLNLFTELP